MRETKLNHWLICRVKLFTFSANSIAPNRKISHLRCCWKRKKKNNFLYMCRIWIKNQEAGIAIVGEDHVKELYQIICFWLKTQLKNKKQNNDNVSLVFSSIINLKKSVKQEKSLKVVSYSFARLNWKNRMKTLCLSMKTSHCISISYCKDLKDIMATYI